MHLLGSSLSPNFLPLISQSLFLSHHSPSWGCQYIFFYLNWFFMPFNKILFLDIHQMQYLFNWFFASTPFFLYYPCFISFFLKFSPFFSISTSCSLKPLNAWGDSSLFSVFLGLYLTPTFFKYFQLFSKSQSYLVRNRIFFQ